MLSDGLSRVMAVRAAALKNLSEDAIPEHTPDGDPRRCARADVSLSPVYSR